MTTGLDLTTTNKLERAFRPRSVAVLGASNDPLRISGRPLYYMKKAGYQGTIYPVNNKRDSVQEIRAYPSLASLPEAPDIALICLPKEAVKDAVRECVDKGVAAAVIFAAGFAETGPAGKILQDEIAAIARQGGLQVFGPNCLGLFHSGTGFMGTFTSAIDEGFVRNGSVAVVGQSGAYGGHLAYLCKARNVGIGYWVSTGNEAITDVAECIAWLAQQEDVSVITASAEGVRDGARFVEALRIAHEYRKPVIFLKFGASAVGAVAAQSHTAALAGSDAVYDSVFRQYGVYRARTTEEQVDIIYACGRGIYPAGRRIGIITVSGGFGIQICDAAERCGLEVAPLPQATQEKLKTINPLGSMKNPCDTTSSFLNDMSLISKTYQLMYSEGGYDSIIGSFTIMPGSPTYGERMRRAIQDGVAGYPDRPSLLCMEASTEVVRSYDDAGFLVYTDSERAARAVAALASLREGFERVTAKPAVDRGLYREFGDSPMSEASAQRLLSGAGIPFLPARVASSADEAVAAAAALGYPVAMKIVSPDILHKTEMGGVILGVASEDETRHAYATLLRRAAEKAPKATIEGVLVTAMAPKGIETIMGVNRDPVFGPVVMFGLGGIFTELFHDVTFRAAPFDKQEAHRMLREIKGYELLRGFRGRPGADIDALAEVLQRLSQFAAANADHLKTIDLNPVVALENGQGVFALDAVVVARKEGQGGN